MLFQFTFRAVDLAGPVSYTDSVCSGYWPSSQERHPCNQSNKQGSLHLPCRVAINSSCQGEQPAE